MSWVSPAPWPSSWQPRFVGPDRVIPGSCKNSVLWGDLIWLSGMGAQEAEDDVEFKEVRGSLGASLPAPCARGASDPALIPQAHWTDMLETLT